MVYPNNLLNYFIQRKRYKDECVLAKKKKDLTNLDPFSFSQNRHKAGRRELKRSSLCCIKNSLTTKSKFVPQKMPLNDAKASMARRLWQRETLQMLLIVALTPPSFFPVCLLCCMLMLAQ